MDTRANTRTRLSVLPVFIALLLNLVVGPLAPAIPSAGQGSGTTALAAPGDPIITQADDASGCMGVVSTPGSENTLKRLISGSLEPGGTATFEISFPVDAEDVGGDFRITDCVFIDTDGDGDTEEGEAVAKYFIDFVPNNEDFILTFTLNIPADAPIGDEYCNFAKTTESPSASQASNRKAGPACFVIGGAIRVEKVDQGGAPLAGATFSISCTYPTTTSTLAVTIIGAPTDGSVTDGNDVNSSNDATEAYTSTSGGVLNVTAVTGSDGVIAVNAPVGTSCTFTETAAPAGYLPPTPPNHTVTLVVPPSGEDAATHTFTNTLVMPDVIVAKSASESTVLAPYSGLIYTLTATNTGTGAATGVVISDDLDDDLTVVSATWDNDPGTTGGTGTCIVGTGNTISCAVGTLAASDGDTTGAEPDTATATITVDVPVAACPSVQNQASVSATNEGDAEDDNNGSDIVTVTVNCPDASVSKTATDPTIIGGDTAAFSITVNGGTLGTASAVTLSDTLPSGFTWTVGGADIGDCSVGATALSAGDTVAGGSLLSCDFGALAANATRTITLSATTTLEACEATISNTATISVAGDTSAPNNTSTATITVECPDASVVKDAVDATIDAGGDASFDIEVTAGGSGDSTNVVLTDVNPADSGRTWTVSGTDAAACGTGDELVVEPGETLSCDFGDIPNGESRTITISTVSSAADCADGIANTASITADDDVDESNNQDSASITVACPDLSLDKSASSLTVLAPNTLEYRIFVSNDVGGATATSVVISDDLDDDLAIVGTVEYDLDDDGTTDGTCDVSAGNVIECQIGDLAPGATASVTITVTVPTEACAGDLTNTASVAAGNESAGDLDNNSDTVNVEVDCPDVSVQKTATDPVISSTESASFSITVDAGTLGTASDVVLNDSLPAGFTWTVGGADIGDCWVGLDTTPLSAGDEVAGGSMLNCNFGPLDGDETRTITLFAWTLETDCDLTISNTAEVTADGDTDTSNNSSTATVDVQCPDLAVVKIADDDVVDAGLPIGFSIGVSNSDLAGTGTAFGVTLEDSLPGGNGIDWEISSVWLNGTQVEVPATYCSISGEPPTETLVCAFGNFEAGDSASVHLTSDTNADSCATYDNVATADAANHAALPSLEASITVQCPGLNLDKSADADPIDAGEEASFTITVWNTGPADALNVTLNEDLPGGLTWDFEIVSGDASEEDCSVASSLVFGGEQQMSIRCDFGTLGVTEMAGGIVIRVFATTDRTDCGLLENSATADASNHPGEPLTRSDTILVKCPEITLDKENDSVGSVLPGTEVTYTLTLTVEDGPAEDVQVVDALPAGLENPTDISDGGLFDSTTGTITWSLGGLADGEYTVTYQAVVANDVENGEELINAAAATSTNSQCPDLETLGPECEDDSTVTVRVPTLVIDKVASTELITLTGPNSALVATPSVVTWTLTYTLANGPVTNAVISDEVPVGFDFLDASTGGTLIDGVVTWTFPTLSASGSVTFRTTVDPETISRVAPTLNVAVIDSDETPEDEGEDSVRVTREEELGGNPTPTPRPSLPNTATGTSLNGEPITVPIELLAAFFIGSLGALALANVKARNRRR